MIQERKNKYKLDTTVEYDDAENKYFVSVTAEFARQSAECPQKRQTG